ncbi:MAG: histidinol-phosphate transaminase [Desulfovibrio sp.]|nr:histidinol-phosphate transaminase [Desulfovibrio sp.]
MQVSAESAASPRVLEHIAGLDPYEPGLSIVEIREKYGLDQIIKLASNENPLGTSNLVIDAIRAGASGVFRYPRGGNPALVRAIAEWHKVPAENVVVGDGSDEIIDMLIRMTAKKGDNIVCFNPCFALYPSQARVADIEIKRARLKDDFSFDLEELLRLTDENTRLAFLTTPDNPTGYCPPEDDVRRFVRELGAKAPRALLVIDEAYMDFAPDEKASSLLASGELPANAAFLRTFSKSFGLAGLRIGYGIVPENIARAFWAARLPFSVNILAEEAVLAALRDEAFREKTLSVVREGREILSAGLARAGCEVFPSSANFIMFRPPVAKPREFFEELLKRGVIIRRLKSYGLPDYFRVSVGSPRENELFLKAVGEILNGSNTGEPA